MTAKIGGNDAVTPWQGYIRGIDRFTYQYSSQAYRTKEVISDVIQQIETFKDACQYIWFDFLDLHNIAGGFMCSLPVQSRLPLAARHIDNDITTTVKQSFSPNRREIYIQQLRELDFYLGILYQYLERNYKDEEIIVSLFPTTEPLSWWKMGNLSFPSSVSMCHLCCVVAIFLLGFRMS